MANSLGMVYKKGKLAATLRRTSSGVLFEYDTEYAQSGLPQIATTLSVSAEPITLVNGATPAFFAGLLPEGPRLTAIRDRIKTSLNDELSLLLDIGADLIGDVQILPEGVSPDLPGESLALPVVGTQFSFQEIREQYFGSRASGIPGVQDKVLSKMSNAPVRLANIDYILKLNPKDVSFVVENEHFFLGRANACGIKTSGFEMMTDSLGDHALRLRRFDRIAKGTSKIKLAAEDGCQVLNQYPAEKYNLGFVEVAAKLISLCPAKQVAGLNLFRQLVFNWLIGNGDAHAKNFSVLEAETGEWFISPAYDLLCTRYYEDRAMALGIDDNQTEWSRALLLETAEKLLVPERAAQKVIDQQLAVLIDLPQQITSGVLPFARHENYEVAKFLKKRAARLV
jgi:serine/threonine-protein kinase HipA